MPRQVHPQVGMVPKQTGHETERSPGPDTETTGRPGAAAAESARVRSRSRRASGSGVDLKGLLKLFQALGSGVGGGFRVSVFSVFFSGDGNKRQGDARETVFLFFLGRGGGLS